MIDATFLNRAAALGRDAAAPTLHTLAGDPEHVHTFAVVDGAIEHKRIELPRPAISHRVATLDDLAAAVAEYAMGDAAEIWVDVGRVVGLIDSHRFTRTIQLPLTWSEPYKTILALESHQPKTQAAIVWLLRHSLAGCVSEDLLPIFRGLRFGQKTDGTARIDHGKETLGRAVDAAVVSTTEAAIPERITAAVPIFQNPGLRAAQEIPLTVEIHTATEQLSISPLPDACQIAADRAVADVAEQLVELAAGRWPVYRGTLNYDHRTT